MARSGILGQSKPSAATNTLLYSTPIDKSASTVLTVANDGTASTFDVGIKDFDQKVTLDAATYKLHEGDVITNQSFQIDTAISSASSLTPGTVLTSGDGEKKAIFHAFKAPDYEEIFVKDVAIRRITINTVTGTFSAGDTISKGASPDDTVATIYEVDSDADNTYLYVGPSTINGSGTEFADADGISGSSGSASGTIISGGVGSANNEFVFSVTTSSGVYRTYFVEGFEYFSDRTYRFDISDSSMSGRDFSLSTTENGEWGPDGVFSTADDGAEYTTGRTLSGTPGNASAYLEFDFTANNDPAATYYFYDGGTGTAANANYGGSDRTITRNTTPTFDELFVYNVEGTWTNNTDTFEFGNTTYTVESQVSGKWGFVRSFDSTTLKIILGPGSSGFAGTDTFFDAPLDTDATRAKATISSVDTDITALEDGQLIVDGMDNTANNVHRITSLVLGPGERVVVQSTTANNTFNLVGFEDNSDEVTVRNFTTGSGGGGGIG